jgi:hypothetical protein
MGSLDRFCGGDTIARKDFTQQTPKKPGLARFGRKIG